MMGEDGDEDSKGKKWKGKGQGKGRSKGKGKAKVDAKGKEEAKLGPTTKGGRVNLTVRVSNVCKFIV